MTTPESSIAVGRPWSQSLGVDSTAIIWKIMILRITRTAIFTVIGQLMQKDNPSRLSLLHVYVHMGFPMAVIENMGMIVEAEA
jgi:hypothetical protein